MSGAGRFLQRWSRLKRQGREVEPAPAVSAPVASSEANVCAAVEPAAVPDVALPAVEGLDLESDFSAFLKKEVSESLRRAALRKLFNDPHFNRMDGLDIYIDDYSVSDPIPADMMHRLRQFDTFLRQETEATPAASPLAEAGSPAEQEDSVSAGDDVQTSEPDGDAPGNGEASPDSGR